MRWAAVKRGAHSVRPGAIVTYRDGTIDRHPGASLGAPAATEKRYAN
jgi:hypothetical protein